MIGTKLKAILTERDVNVNELSRRIGVSAQTLYSVIKRNTNKIDFNVLLKICTELDIPVELFYGSYRPTGLPEIEELNLLQKIRELDDHGRELVNLVLNSEHSRVIRCHKPKIKTAFKIIPLYESLAAIGYVKPVIGTDFEEIEVPSESAADFAVKIDGISLESDINNGSIILVSRCLQLSDGDIGLFIVDGKMLSMQYSEDGSGNICLFPTNNDTDHKSYSGNDISAVFFGKILLT